ncbi:MAG: class II glutamine amidotransferase, partial [Planctomycetales bacterium]
MKKEGLRDSLGELVTPMLDCMGSRGPDSAGLAVFHEPLDTVQRRYALYCAKPDWSWQALHEEYQRSTDRLVTVNFIENHATIVSSIQPEAFRCWLSQTYPCVHLLSVGSCIDVYKDEGHPGEIARRYQFAELTGSHAVGHTRMATESAVSPAHAHPFTAGEDFCLVHNGSLSNPYSIRRQLERKGIQFETDNDTEAGCRFLEWRMREGDTLEQAIETSFDELDGFFTFLMATADKMVLVR